MNKSKIFGLWVMASALNAAIAPSAHSETVEIVVEGVVGNSNDYLGLVFDRGSEHDALVGANMRLAISFDTDDWKSFGQSNPFDGGVTWVPLDGLTGERISASLTLDGQAVLLPGAVTLGALSGDAYVADRFSTDTSGDQDYYYLRFTLLDAQQMANGVRYRSNTFNLTFQAFATDFLQGSTLNQSFEQGGGTFVYWSYGDWVYGDSTVLNQEANVSMYATSVSYRAVSAVPELSTFHALCLGLPGVLWLGMRRRQS